MPWAFPTSTPRTPKTSSSPRASRSPRIAGPDYVNRDKFARLLTFRGDWNAEYKKYNAEGDKIFSSFARGVNAAIQQAIDQKRVPVEFQILGFQPEPVWTAQTVLTRM